VGILGFLAKAGWFGRKRRKSAPVVGERRHVGGWCQTRGVAVRVCALCHVERPVSPSSADPLVCHVCRRRYPMLGPGRADDPARRRAVNRAQTVASSWKGPPVAGEGVCGLRCGPRVFASFVAGWSLHVS
jgi:hypothetical protein